jgi:hypothetical protein
MLAAIPSIPADPLTEIELRIARRADELARECEVHTSMDLQCWLRAEAEILRSSKDVSFAPPGSPR